MKHELPIPEAALRDHIAVLAKTGAGKTSDTKVIVEHITTPGWQNLPHGARVCILDPIKSDYWGLTSSSDGKRPGRPFQILGGPHGHVPLNSQSGKVIGELVASGALRLSILDMSDFEPGGLQRFFSAFADTIFRKNKGILYLVIEEAHEFAPKERSGMGNENLSIHHFKKLATGTRSKGIRVIACSQRTQALHNAVLGSCETIIAGRFTLPADQEPVLKWFKGNTSKEKYQEISASISSLKNGETWVACGEAGFLERVQFPRISTFDNSATPEHGTEAVEVRTAPVDRSALAKMIGLAAEEAVANDPTALRAKVAELTAQLAKAGTVQAIAPDPHAYAKGRADAYSDAMGDIQVRLEPIYDLIGDLNSGVTKLRAAAHDIEGWAIAAAGNKPAQIITEIIPAAAPIQRAAAPALAKPVEGQRLSATGLSRPQTAILAALGWWASFGHRAPTRAQVGMRAGLKARGGHFKTSMSGLSVKGLITYPSKDTVSLTEAGATVPTGEALTGSLLDQIRSMLNEPQAKIFDAMLAGHTSRASIAEAANMGAAGGHFKTSISGLSVLGLITYPDKSTAKLQDWVK